MKTVNTAIQSTGKVKTRGPERILPVMLSGSKQVLALSGALTAATALVVLGVWVSALEATSLAGAVTWALGFIFLGMAVDEQGFEAITHMAVGLVLLLIAWLQNSVSADFTIVSSTVLAVWAAMQIFRLLR